MQFIDLPDASNTIVSDSETTLSMAVEKILGGRTVTHTEAVMGGPHAMRVYLTQPRDGANSTTINSTPGGIAQFVMNMALNPKSGVRYRKRPSLQARKGWAFSRITVDGTPALLATPAWVEESVAV